jgi:glutaminase
MNITTDLGQVLTEIAENMAHRSDRGEIATYIPELGRIDPKSFGIAVVDANGNIAAAGDSDTPFSTQSVSKVFTLTLATARQIPADPSRRKDNRGREAACGPIACYPKGSAAADRSGSG